MPSTRVNKLTSFNIDLKITDDANPVKKAQGTFDMYCMDEPDAHIVIGEVFSDALNGYFGKGGLTVPPPGSLIIDAGANIGAFSVFMKRVVPDCKVYSFEPMPETFSTLKANFDHHGIPGKPSNLGLGRFGCPDTLSFTYYPNRPACSTYRPEDKERANIEPLLNNPKAFCGLYKETNPDLVKEVEAMEPEAAKARIKEIVEEQWISEEVTVPMKTLDDCLKEEGLVGQVIEFLKVDVEGAELDVLLGISDDTWKNIKQLAVEVHDFDNRLEEMQQLLRDKGFGHVVAHGIDVYNDEYGMNHHFVYGRKD